MPSPSDRQPMEAAMFPRRQEGGEVAAGRAAMPDRDAEMGQALAEVGAQRRRAEAAELGRATADARIEELTARIDTLAEALRLALPELREDLEALVESNIVGEREYIASQPLPDDLDPEVLTIATDKKTAHDAVVAAIALAERGA
jgi:chromosome segregation ATPase